VALLVSPGSLQWLFALGFLGYRTRVTVVVLLAFVVGFTMTTILSAFLGAIGGAIGSVTYKPPHVHAIAPWRDPKWRQLVKNQLGAQCPNDTRPISPPIFNMRLNIAQNLPEDRRVAEIAALHAERFSAESDDLDWSQWYDHYSRIVLLPDDKDVVQHIHTGLAFNLQTAALYLLASAIFVARVRHWWCIVPAVAWVSLLVVENVVVVQKLSNEWSTLSQQIKYLSLSAGVKPGKTSAE
jgi:hypothetical protein